MAQPRRVPVAQARASLKDLVQEVKGKRERIKLTRYDHTVAGIVPASDLRLLEDCQEALEDCEKAKAAAEEPRPAGKRRPRRARQVE
jgi:PHD/YefM family antitoxin component YafN of YafNO toxin-antitoxin module